MQTIEMVETAPRRWEAEIVVERRRQRWLVVCAGGLAALYALIGCILGLTGFR